MKKYFIHLEEQEGPFTVEELQTRNIKRDTPVWFDGLPEWKKAVDIDELKNLFGATPPPYVNSAAPPPYKKKENVQPPPQRNQQSIKAEAAPTGRVEKIAAKLENYRPGWEKKRNYWKWVAGILVVIVIAGMIVIPKVQLENAKSNFQANPEYYIVAGHNGFKYNRLMGGISELKVTVVNRSQFGVDNVRCIVSYIRKNGETYKEEIVESGYIPAYGNVVIDAPGSSAGMGVNVRVYKVNSSEAGVY